MLQNRIYNTKQIEWRLVKDLQPNNLKIPYNYENVKKSILKYGISKAYDVCELDGELYWIDGHTRTDILKELIADGVQVPNKITANFCKVKDKDEAIKILLDVHNQRQNPIDKNVLDEWIDVVDLEVNEVALNIKPVEIEIDNSDLDLGGEDLEHNSNNNTTLLILLILKISNSNKKKYKELYKISGCITDDEFLTKLIYKYYDNTI